MRTNPDPDDSPFFGRGIDTDCAVMDSHPNGPDIPDFLEVKRWMIGIGLEKGKGPVGSLADVGWQMVVERPKIRTGEVVYRLPHLPASKSDRALFIRSRNGPDF